MSKELLCRKNGEEGLWLLSSRHAALPWESIPHSIVPETGVLIPIGSPPGVGPGIIGIVRRSEIRDQGLGWTGH